MRKALGGRWVNPFFSCTRPPPKSAARRRRRRRSHCSGIKRINSYVSDAYTYLYRTRTRNNHTTTLKVLNVGILLSLLLLFDIPTTFIYPVESKNNTARAHTHTVRHTVRRILLHYKLYTRGVL